MRLRPPLSTEDSHVHSLAELQASVARAVMMGERGPVAAALVGGDDPSKRLEIHQRHYQASLAAALRDKFPACAWLAGADLVSAAARAYVRAYPPRQPCIAEYGSDFPQVLARHGRALALPYLESFAALEWAVAQVSIAIDYSRLSWPDLAHVGAELLMESPLALQPGLRYVRSSWRVDELMTMYLRDAVAERLVLPQSDTFIEVRGARGTVALTRLDAAAFTFRRELAAGRTIADAAGLALEWDTSFDPGEALRQLVHAGLVTRVAEASKS
jgi:hypothetical protein